MDYREEMRRITVKALEQEYSNGRLQGVHEFYLMLRDTHKTPDEIYEYLKKNSCYDRN